MKIDQARLYSTTDARVWAEEWCKVAQEIATADDDREVIDEGWMIGWFANAIVTAEGHERGRLADLIEENAATIGSFAADKDHLLMLVVFMLRLGTSDVDRAYALVSEVGGEHG